MTKIFDWKQDPDYADYLVCSRTGLRYYKKSEIREYSESYFLEEYKNQYNKTYFEDEQGLRKLARRRLGYLQKMKKSGSLLEIGCAAGFFLDEAVKSGYDARGIDVSASAVSYAQKNGLHASTISFLDYPENEKFDIICAFFVIEHFPDQEMVLDRINKLLKPGGIFFTGLPSLRGPVFCTNPDEWFKTHPSDHFVDYSVSSAKKVFGKLGWKISGCWPMSSHQERDRGWRGKLPEWAYKKLADMTCYGDTIHILAKKIQE